MEFIFFIIFVIIPILGVLAIRKLTKSQIEDLPVSGLQNTKVQEKLLDAMTYKDKTYVNNPGTHTFTVDKETFDKFINKPFPIEISNASDQSNLPKV